MEPTLRKGLPRFVVFIMCDDCAGAAAASCWAAMGVGWMGEILGRDAGMVSQESYNRKM